MPEALYAIQPRVRRVVLDLLGRFAAGPEALVTDLGERRGFRTVSELDEFLRDMYGVPSDQHSERLRAAGGTTIPTSGALARNHATAVLVALPDDLFLSAVAQAFHDARFSYPAPALDFETRVTEMFIANALPYRVESGQITVTMSPAASIASTQPAADVLADPRLAVSRGHFNEAQRRLGEPDPDEAVDEARLAVEAALLAVIDATPTVERPDRRVPNELFAALEPVIGRDAQELVLATPRFRGRTSAGHSGGAPVTLGEAQAAVAAAAAALLYLASKLP